MQSNHLVTLCHLLSRNLYSKVFALEIWHWPLTQIDYQMRFRHLKERKNVANIRNWNLIITFCLQTWQFQSNAKLKIYLFVEIAILMDTENLKFKSWIVSLYQEEGICCLKNNGRNLEQNYYYKIIEGNLSLIVCFLVFTARIKCWQCLFQTSFTISKTNSQCSGKNKCLWVFYISNK